MSRPLTADASLHPCQAHGYHQPAPVWTHWHHPIPKAWTDALGMPEDDRVPLCPHGHDVLHHLLRKALRGEPYSAGPVIRGLIEEAVAFYEEHMDQQATLMALAP